MSWQGETPEDAGKRYAHVAFQENRHGTFDAGVYFADWVETDEDGAPFEGDDQARDEFGQALVDEFLELVL